VYKKINRKIKNASDNLEKSSVLDTKIYMGSSLRKGA